MTILAIDTETRGLNAEAFICGVACREDESKETFFNREEMAKWILSFIHKEAIRGNKTMVYAHNMEYDFYTIFMHMKDRFKYISIGRPFIALWECTGTKNCGRDDRIFGHKDYWGSFHCTTDIFPMALEKIGENIGHEKWEMPEELTNENMEIDFWSLSKISKYCARDTEIVMKAIKRLREDSKEKFGFQPRRILTAGQVAIATYATWARKNCPENDPTETYWRMIAGYNEEKRRWEIAQTMHEDEIRVAYRGGINIAWKTGKFKDATMIDINSLYGYVMSSMRFPDIKNEYRLEGSPGYMDYMGSLGFAKARIKLGDGEGILPVRSEGMMMFPEKRGLTMESVWTTRELAKARELGHKITDIRWHILYPEMRVNPLTEYMRILQRQKEEAKDGFEREMAKIRMNALSGKFGQRAERKQIEFCHRREGVQKSREGWEILGVMGESYAISKGSEKAERPYFVNPAISAMITAEARLMMWKEIMKIDYKDRLYCDTDSIIMTNFRKYEDELNIGNKTGQWKIVTDKETITIKGEKKYMAGKRIKTSGVPKRYRTREGFEKGVFRRKRMVSMGEEMQGKGTAGTFREEEIRIEERAKKDLIVPDRIVDL